MSLSLSSLSRFSSPACCSASSYMSSASSSTPAACRPRFLGAAPVEYGVKWKDLLYDRVNAALTYPQRCRKPMKYHHYVNSTHSDSWRSNWEGSISVKKMYSCTHYANWTPQKWYAQNVYFANDWFFRLHINAHFVCVDLHQKCCK